MEIKCTPQELKELMQNNTPVARTTDVNVFRKNKDIPTNILTVGKPIFQQNL